MFATHKVRKALAGLVLAAFLAGCSAAPTPTPTAIPTIDPKPTFDAIATQSAATVIAGLTQNAPTATPVTPTSTPTETFTPAPTDTPAPTATPTRVFIPWTKTPTPTTPDYACSVLSVSPSTVAVNTAFDASWSLKNTGLKTWLSSDLDVTYSSGTKLQKSKNIYDLNSDVAPNGTYTAVVDMVAPSGDGSFTTTWVIKFPDDTTCAMTLNLTVTK